MTQFITIIASILSIIIGLWKFFGRKRKERQDAANKVKEGIDKDDPSVITSGFDGLHR